MATYNVSNSTQLKSALSKASGGNTVKLAGGSYGSLTLSKKFGGNVTITSDGNAKFSGMTLKSAGNVTINNVAFDGGGTSRSATAPT